MGSPCAVRGCGSARRTLAPPRPAIHLQDGKGDPSHLLFMVYVHELTTCALTAGAAPGPSVGSAPVEAARIALSYEAEARG